MKRIKPENKLDLKSMSKIIGGGNTHWECTADTNEWKCGDTQTDFYGDNGKWQKGQMLIKDCPSPVLV